MAEQQKVVVPVAQLDAGTLTSLGTNGWNIDTDPSWLIFLAMLAQPGAGERPLLIAMHPRELGPDGLRSLADSNASLIQRTPDLLIFTRELPAALPANLLPFPAPDPARVPDDEPPAAD